MATQPLSTIPSLEDTKERLQLVKKRVIELSDQAVQVGEEYAKAHDERVVSSIQQRIGQVGF